MSQMQQSPLDKTINAGMQALDQVGKTLGNIKNPGEAVSRAIDVGNLVLKGSASVKQLDDAVTNLEKAAPGTLDTINSLSETLKAANSLIDPRAVPNALKPIHKDLKEATENFSDFTKSYQEYQKTKDLSMLNPFNWGKQTAAALETKQDWDKFKASWDKLEATAKKVGGTLVDDAVDKAIDKAEKILDNLFNPLDF